MADFDLPKAGFADGGLMTIADARLANGCCPACGEPRPGDGLCEKCAVPQSTGWQPIETAPKDIPILGYRRAADSTLPEFYAVIWWGKALSALSEDNCWLIYDGKHGGYGYGPFFVFNGPTRWMPLPSPPEDVHGR